LGEFSLTEANPVIFHAKAKLLDDDGMAFLYPCPRETVKGKTRRKFTRKMN
jgi:hypothetical protein